VIAQNENTSPSKQTAPKKKRFWSRFSAVFFGLILLIWLIPYLFSNFLFNNLIKRAFAEITKQEYTLDFKDVKINIFTRKITFFSTEISSTDTLATGSIQLKSDTLVLHHINLRSLRKERSLKFEDIFIKSLKLRVNQSENKMRNFNLPQSQYFTDFFLGNLQIAHAYIVYKQKNDSLLLPNLSLQIRQIHFDSLSDTVKTNRYHFSLTHLNLKNQYFVLPDKSHSIYLKNLSLSTPEKSFTIDSLKIKATAKHNSKTYTNAYITKLALTHFEFDSLLYNKSLIAGNIKLIMRYIHTHQKTNENTKSNLKEEINSFIQTNFSKIKIDSSWLSVKQGVYTSSKKERLSLSGFNNIRLVGFQFSPQQKVRYSLSDGHIQFSNLRFYIPGKKQNFQIKKTDFDYKTKEIKFSGLVYKSDSTPNLSLKLQEVKLQQTNWAQWLNRDRLFIENLELNRGKIKQIYPNNEFVGMGSLNRLDSLFSPYFESIQIQTIHFNNWDYSLASKGIEAKDIKLTLNQFSIPIDSSASFKLFSDFKTKAKSFSWVSKDQNQHYLIKNLDINSRLHSIKLNSIQAFPRWKSLKNQELKPSARFKLLGESIQIKTSKAFNLIHPKEKIKLRQLSIDSVQLEIFGKNQEDDINPMKFPPLFIDKFNLRKGNFAVYQDSTTESRLSQINGIHLESDSLYLSSDTSLQIDYAKLLATSKKGFYQNKARGVNFNFKRTDYDSKDEELSFHQLKASLTTKGKEKNSTQNLSSILLQIKGFNHNLYLRSHLITAKEFKLTNPKIISKSQSKNKQKLGLKQLLSVENLQALPYLKFDYFIVNGLSWINTSSVVDITFAFSVERANFEARDFLLSYQSFKDSSRVFFSKSIHFKIYNFRQKLQNGNFLLLIDSINFSSTKNNLLLNKIQFYTLQKANRNNYNFNVKQIVLDKINFAELQQNFGLDIRNIRIFNPKAKMRFYGFKENALLTNLNTLDLFPSINPYLNKINFGRIDISDMDFFLEKGSNVYKLNNLDLLAQDFQVDKFTKAFKENRFFYTKNTLFHLGNYSASIADEFYRLNFSNLKLSTLEGSITIDSLRLIPQFDYSHFAQKAVYQTDRFDVAVNKLKCSGIDFQDALFRQKYIVQRIDIEKLKGEIYRDGLYPRKPNFYPKNPIQRFVELPYFIQVDSLFLKNSDFAYKEKGSHMEEPGHIFFSQLAVQLFNISNNPDFIKYGGNTVFHAQSLLMGKSNLSINANFPLSEQGKVFHLDAHLDKIKMDDLEPIFKPLALITARSGIVKSVDLSVEGNDDYAYGSMMMLYYDMKIDVLKKSMKKGFFGSLFANALLKTENPSYVFPRKGPIYFERNKMRSIFNYWAEISILGMKTSMGLADRRIAKKVKKLEKK
jgi:hypothetical protein